MPAFLLMPHLPKRMTTQTRRIADKAVGIRATQSCTPNIA